MDEEKTREEQKNDEQMALDRKTTAVVWILGLGCFGMITVHIATICVIIHFILKYW